MSTQKIKYVKNNNFISAYAKQVTWSHNPNGPSISLSFLNDSIEVNSITIEESDDPQKKIAFTEGDTTPIRDVICRIDMPIIALEESCKAILDMIKSIKELGSTGKA